MDSPSGNEQILSKAKACFDEGDFDCAREYYAKLSSEYSDIKESESAFLILDEQGIDMGVFMTAFGSGGSGKGVTQIANRLALLGANTTKRASIYEAYLKVGIISDRATRGLVRFVTGIALLAEVLAEQAGGNSNLDQTDLITSGTLTACKASTSVTCAAACTRTSALGVGASVDLYNSLPTSSTITGTDHYGLIHGIIQALSNALSYELSAGGNFSTGIGGFTNQLLSQSAPTTSAFANCFVKILLDQGIGN
tara:strand:- start:769 stop:1527 length:759 start_codon:yes stop_codon:yes gene_type:complete